MACLVAAYKAMNGAGRKPKTELTLMIRPLPCSRICGSTARVIRIAPKTLVSNTARVCSIELSSAAPATPTPALLTKTSMRPDRSSTPRTTPPTDSSSVTSSGSNTTPSRVSSAVALRLVPYTVNPAPTSARAAASPIPTDAPVTSATRRMRYGKDHKQATRQRILEAGGRRFKQDGIDGAGVAAVMSDAGLTNGAFYAHFSSKADLVANVLADQLRVQRESFRAAPSDRAGLESLIRAYLSPEHRDQSADGCPSAALLDEIVRRPAGTKDVFTDEVLATGDDIAARLDRTDADAARTDALTLLGFVIGTLQLSRALTDRDLSDQLLAQGVETALKLLDDRASPRA